jgi:VanZ family protein
MLKLIKNWLPVVLWAGLIFYLSSQPGLKSGLVWPYDFILGKGAHVTEFAVLFLLLYRAMANYSLEKPAGREACQKASKKALLWAFVATILYAAFDEFHQFFVAGRVASLTDVAIDSLGVLLLIEWRLRRLS